MTPEMTDSDLMDDVYRKRGECITRFGMRPNIVVMSPGTWHRLLTMNGRSTVGYSVIDGLYRRSELLDCRVAVLDLPTMSEQDKHYIEFAIGTEDSDG